MTFPNTWDGGTLDILFSSNHMNFYECCDLTKKVFLGLEVEWAQPEKGIRASFTLLLDRLYYFRAKKFGEK